MSTWLVVLIVIIVVLVLAIGRRDGEYTGGDVA